MRPSPCSSFTASLESLRVAEVLEPCPPSSTYVLCGDV